MEEIEMIRQYLIPMAIIGGAIGGWFWCWLLSEAQKAHERRRKAILKFFKNKEDAEFMHEYWGLNE